METSEGLRLGTSDNKSGLTRWIELFFKNRTVILFTKARYYEALSGILRFSVRFISRSCLSMTKHRLRYQSQTELCGLLVAQLSKHFLLFVTTNSGLHSCNELRILLQLKATLRVELHPRLNQRWSKLEVQQHYSPTATAVFLKETLRRKTFRTVIYFKRDKVYARRKRTKKF